jgi:hypothetical protein
LKAVDFVIGLRVTTEEEEIGLDLTQHGERGYIMGAGELLAGHGQVYVQPYRKAEEPVHV